MLDWEIYTMDEMTPAVQAQGGRMVVSSTPSGEEIECTG